MKKEIINQENYYIDFLKFIFSLIIMFYHSWIFTGVFGNGLMNYGFYGVDFYFIVTGYLMMNSISKDKKNKVSTFEFIVRKIKRLVPSIIITFIIGYCLVYGKNCVDIRNLLTNNIIAEFLQLSILGYPYAINSALWYVSSMIIVLFILYPLVIKYKDKYIYFIAPLILLFALGFINSFDININDPVLLKVFLRNGFYKGLIFIILGNISFEIANYIKRNKFNNIRRWIITILETIVYLILIINMHFNYVGSLLVAILFTVNIAITFSNISYVNKLFKHSIWKKLGKLGFYIFLINIPVRAYLLRHNGHSYHQMLFRFTLITITLAIISYIIVEIMYPMVVKKIKKFYI